MEIIAYPEDMDGLDKEKLMQFSKAGCPGINNIRESDIFKWLNLYMAGKTYAEIATITNKKKELILYMSNKMQWYDKKLKHYTDITNNLMEKITNAKLDSTNSITTMITALGKYYRETFTKFLANNDRTIIEGVDTKMLSQYHKLVDSLEKITLNNSEDAPNNASVNINIGGNANVNSDPKDNSIDITPDLKDGTDVAKALEILTKLKRKKRDS